MRKSYLEKIALPEEIEFYATVEKDEDVNQNNVDTFVNALDNRPGWYKHDSSKKLDTRLYMMEVHQPFKTESISGKLTRVWTCECCENTVLYEGLQIGHIRAWKDELKQAGVLDNSEAKAAYNNLTNLRIECSTCNQSHDWE